MSIQHGSALWRYRGFVFGSVKREFQARYQNSLLGSVWNVLQPLAMILVYTLVFANLMRARMQGMDGPYSFGIYLCAGILPWGLFSEIVSRGQGVFLDNGNMLKKLSFPRIALPAIIMLGALLNFAIVLSLFLVFLAITGHFPGIEITALLVLIALQVAFATGLGIVLGVLNVFFRDVGQLFNIVLQFWFWFTPIVYPLETLPAFVRPWIALNPMTGLIQGYHAVFFQHQWPQWSALWPLALVAVLSCGFGMWLFRRHAGEMVDEL